MADKNIEDVFNNDLPKEDLTDGRYYFDTDHPEESLSLQQSINNNDINLNNNFNEQEYEVNNTTIFAGEPQLRPISWWLLFTVLLGVYFVSSFFVGFIVLTPTLVQGASMYPTLNSGDDIEETCDVVYMQKNNNYKRGDIIIYDAQNYLGLTESEYHIKRVVALAGDTVQFVKIEGTDVAHKDEDGNITHYTAEYWLYINGELQKESYVNSEGLTNVGANLLSNAFLNDISESAQHKLFFAKILSEEIITIPIGSIFALGDNRAISYDGRYIGPVSLNDCIGKVVFTIEYGDNLFQAIYKSIKNK